MQTEGFAKLIRCTGVFVAKLFRTSHQHALPYPIHASLAEGNSALSFLTPMGYQLLAKLLRISFARWVAELIYQLLAKLINKVDR